MHILSGRACQHIARRLQGPNDIGEASSSKAVDRGVDLRVAVRQANVDSHRRREADDGRPLVGKVELID